MKKIKILVILILVSVIKLNAQKKLNLGISAGYINLSQDIKLGSSPLGVVKESGFYIGIYKSYKISDKIKIQPEINWGLISGKKENYHQIFMPLILKYYFIEKINIQIGPQIDFDFADSSSEETNVFGFGGLVGLEYAIKENIFVTTRYVLGFTDTYKKNTLNLNGKTNVFQFGLGYRF